MLLSAAVSIPVLYDKKEKPHHSAVFIWCRLAELNCQFSITIAAYCHYTKAAALIYNTKFAEEFNTQSANKFLTPQFPAFILSSRFTAKRQKTKAAASESQKAYQLYESPMVSNNRMKQGTSTIS